MHLGHSQQLRFQPTLSLSSLSHIFSFCGTLPCLCSQWQDLGWDITMACLPFSTPTLTPCTHHTPSLVWDRLLLSPPSGSLPTLPHTPHTTTTHTHNTHTPFACCLGLDGHDVWRMFRDPVFLPVEGKPPTLLLSTNLTNWAGWALCFHCEKAWHTANHSSQTFPFLPPLVHVP